MKIITRYNEAIAMAQETVLPDRPKRTKEWYQLSITELQKAQEHNANNKLTSVDAAVNAFEDGLCLAGLAAFGGS